MRLDPAGREALLASLSGMTRYLSEAFGGLAAEEVRRRGKDDAFSPVEQVWHLADLEREGFGERILRLRTEETPLLPDFDGARIAAERDYRSRSFAEGLAAFAAAREANLAALRAVAPAEWVRNGTQEGVGPVSLCDMPSFMSQHDAAHRAEIEQWMNTR